MQNKKFKNLILSESVVELQACQFNYIVERFNSKVNKNKEDECWEWTGSYFTYGYGYLGIAGKNISATRISFAIHNNKTPGKFFVCHKCDNPKCVNPEHLYLGTPQDNMNDMKNRGRSLRGERSPSSKLSNEDVQQIKNRYRNGEYQRTLAEEFGVAREHVNKIINGKKRIYGI